MHFDWPMEEQSYTAVDQHLQYMLGPSILVATIATDMPDFYTACNWTVWLPPHTAWVLLSTQTIHTGGDGGMVLTRPYLADEYPVFLRAGSVLISLPPAIADDEFAGRASRPMERLVVNIAAPNLSNGTGARYRLYEDDGQAYEGVTTDVPHVWTDVSYVCSRADEQEHTSVVLELLIASSGTFPTFPATRSWDISITPAWPATSVRVGNVTLPLCVNSSTSKSVFGASRPTNAHDIPRSGNYECWGYAGETASVDVALNPRPSLSELRVIVEFDPPVAGFEGPSGVMGMVRRGDLAKQYLAIDRKSAPPADLSKALQLIAGLPLKLEEAARAADKTAFLAALNQTSHAQMAGHQAAIEAYGAENFVSLSMA